MPLIKLHWIGGISGWNVDGATATIVCHSHCVCVHTQDKMKFVDDIWCDGYLCAMLVAKNDKHRSVVVFMSNLSARLNIQYFKCDFSLNLCSFIYICIFLFRLLVWSAYFFTYSRPLARSLSLYFYHWFLSSNMNKWATKKFHRWEFFIRFNLYTHVNWLALLRQCGVYISIK